MCIMVWRIFIVLNKQALATIIAMILLSPFVLRL